MKKNSWIVLAAALAVSPGWLVPASGDEEGSRSKSFTVSKGGLIEVSIDGGDVLVNTWDKNEVFVKAEGIDEDDLDRLKMAQSGNTVRVELRRRWSWSRNSRFEISVPTQFDTDLNTAGGRLEIRGNLSGTIKGKTSGGDIMLRNVGGRVDMSTSGGDIRTGDIQGDVRLRTSGGDIELGKVGGEVNVSTSGGDIRVQSVGRKLSASTSGGDIIVGDVGGEASVSTAGGDVKVRSVSGSVRISTAGGDIVLSSGSGMVEAKTAGGDIRLDDISGSVEAKTAGGDVTARLNPSGKGRSRLATAGGEVTLYLPDDAKATVEALIRLEGWWRSKKGEYRVNSDFKADYYQSDDDSREIRAKYTINGGGEVITLETVNSDIYIKKSFK